MLWENLNIEVQPGEFIAVLGPNGAGKTSLLKVLLGLLPLESGSVTIGGETPRRGHNFIGYVPQQRSFDPDLPIRGRDLVRLGLDGHRYGLRPESAKTRTAVNRMVKRVGAASYADAPIGLLSGGEQQRLRIAQALIGNPRVLLCDEPLLSLDLSHQQAVSNLIDEERTTNQSAVLFVTHEINPILPIVDRILYLVGGKWAIGTPKEILSSKRLGELYGSPVEVIRMHGRILVVPSNEAQMAEHSHHPEPGANV